MVLAAWATVATVSGDCQLHATEIIDNNSGAASKKGLRNFPHQSNRCAAYRDHRYGTVELSSSDIHRIHNYIFESPQSRHIWRGLRISIILHIWGTSFQNQVDAQKEAA